MKIACLQFSPQVGDVANNLNRADAVLNKADEKDLQNLDILVLPELAFTGYNFTSLQHISPYLEPSGSGISALWARTTALKYDCSVCVGYPEKVDVTEKWPTSPEYYSSMIIANGDGETIANYRKQFLFSIDETWALEGKDGFFEGYIPGLGRVSLGICMDLNPYKFEAPWSAFEFAFHILHTDSNVVIITMSWLTQEDKRQFSRQPHEPDLETLTYWVSRLEPLIRAEQDEEKIVIFCNRTGIEGDVCYAGTSAVLGIKGGEVLVYGLLGRGVKELLVVDTSRPPIQKLVHRPESDFVVPGAVSPTSSTRSNNGSERSTSPRSRMRRAAQNGDTVSQSKATPQKPPTRPHLVTQTLKFAGDERRQERPSPKLQIPPPPPERHGRAGSIPTIVDESPIIPTPTAPSPTPQVSRPKLSIPSEPRPTKEHLSTPYPYDPVSSSIEDLNSPLKVLGGNVAIEAATPNDYASREKSKYFWIPSQTVLKTPALPMSPIASAADSSFPKFEEGWRDIATASQSRQSRSEGRARPDDQDQRTSSTRRKASSREVAFNNSPRTPDPVQPARPSPRGIPPNTSRKRDLVEPERRHSESPNLKDITQRLAALKQLDYQKAPAPVSPTSTVRSMEAIDRPQPDRILSLSRASIPIAASPSIFESSKTSERPTSRRGQRDRDDSRPQSRNHSRSLSQSANPAVRRCSCSVRTMSPFDPAASQAPGRPPSLGPPKAPTAPARPDSRTAQRQLPGSHSRTVSRGRTRVEKDTVGTQNTDPAQAQPSQSDSPPGTVRELFRSTSRPVTQDDEIVAIVEINSAECELHGPSVPTEGATCPPMECSSVTTGETPRSLETRFEPRTPKAMATPFGDIESPIDLSDAGVAPENEKDAQRGDSGSRTVVR